VSLHPAFVEDGLRPSISSSDAMEDGSSGRVISRGDDEGFVRGSDMSFESEDDERWSEEGRRPKIISDPGKLSRKELEDHMPLHIPYRAWCPHCVRGRGINNLHVAGNEYATSQVPMVCLDYGFLRSKDDRDAHPEDTRMGPILVLKHAKHGMQGAMVVPAKGVEGPWVAKRYSKWIEGLGFNRIILRTDGGNAIVALASEIKHVRGDLAETILEHPEKGESQSNGIIERAVGTTWTPRGIRLMADPRHATEVVKALGLEKANGVVTPGVPEAKGREVESGSRGCLEVQEEVTREQATLYRAVGGSQAELP
jgi:hypothetical protein